MMLMWDEETVRIECVDGGVDYYWLAGAVRVVNGEPINTDGSAVLFAHYVDPLTSEVQSGLCSYEYAYIKNIRCVATLPIAEDFEIDSKDRFFRLDPSNYHQGNIPDNPMIAMQFWDAFHNFVRANEASLVSRRLRPESPLRKSDFTEFGLDFLRQHYRFVKADSIRKQTAPTLHLLQRLLALTLENRTTDADWTKPDVGRWIGKEIES